MIDLDIVKYSVSSMGEKRYILVEHTNGYSEKFDNRTQFYGRGKKKDGGELSKLNANRDSPYSYDEFTITDIVVPEPLPLVLSATKNTVKGILNNSGCKSYKGFIGKGESFRKELSTLLEYKGNRKNLTKPHHLDAVTEYLETAFKAETVEHFEADDIIVFECWKDKNKFAITTDKDSYGTPVYTYNPSKPQDGILDCNKFGKLFRDEKGKVRGFGRIFLYFQICSNDKIDNYAANSFSDVKWGEVSAYNALKDCTNDREAFLAIKVIFQHLYPEPKLITGWRGDEILIDWKYVFSECFMMARMWRHENDYVDPLEVMERMTGSLAE